MSHDWARGRTKVAAASRRCLAVGLTPDSGETPPPLWVTASKWGNLPLTTQTTQHQPLRLGFSVCAIAYAGLIPCRTRARLYAPPKAQRETGWQKDLWAETSE